MDSSWTPGEAGAPSFGDRLAQEVTRRGSRLVLGYDPDPAWLPPPVAGALAAEMGGAEPEEALRRAAEAVRRVGERLLEACEPFVAAVKVQMAFFLALGPWGLAALRRVVECAHGLGLPVIADAKPGDIGTTAAAYARALVGRTLLPGGGEVAVVGADACTFNPYLGPDSVQPFLEWVDREGRGVFVVVHTSNPGARALQALRLQDGRSVAEAVADMVREWAQVRRGASGYAPVGAVVGATYPEAVAALRRRLPGVWMLLPGVGAQGAAPEAAAAAFDAQGLGGLVSVSRGILGAWRTDGGAGAAWEAAAAAAARRLRDSIESARRAAART